MWKLIFVVLLAVLAESRRAKPPLNLNGSSTIDYKQLKIRSKFLPKDSESNSHLKLERTGILESVYMYSPEGSLIPDRVDTPESISDVKTVEENEHNRKHHGMQTSEILRVADGSNELMKNIPARGQESQSLLSDLLGYFNFGAQHDLEIDPEFEHLPEVPQSEIDPDFENLPSRESGNSLDWQYVPTNRSRVEIAAESVNLQRSQMLHEDQNDTESDLVEEYYFDNYDDESKSITINQSDTLKQIINFTTLDTTEQMDSTLQFSDNATQMINPTGNVPVAVTNDQNEFLNEEEYDYSLGNDLVHHSRKNLFFDSVDDKFRSFVFNPVARPQEKFQECMTPRNESGHCRYVQHCFLPHIIASLGNFLKYVCIIQERYIGICCPDFPVHTLEVSWKLPSAELQLNPPENVTQPEGGCGVNSKTRIVGGDKADPKEWPWMAALLSKIRGNFFCGGALINSKYVLTAAHCTFRVPENQILVRLGEYDFSDSDDGPGEDYPVLEIKRHALYSRKTLRNDIALLKLGRSAKFDQFVSTVCLPQRNDLYIGQMATLAGWGNLKGGGPTSKVLMEASFPVWSNAECTEVQGIQIRKVFLCAGSKEKDKGGCNGDSGGPLMLLDEHTKQWKAIGIVSWGRRGCDTRYPTVFTRVSSYLRWIKIHSSD